MNISKLSFLILSLPAATLWFPYSAANAALRISNSSLTQNIAQTNAARAVAAQQALEPQPARVVTNSNGETLNVSPAAMDSCNSIYPGGQFDWIVPTTGSKGGGPATCAALVELRAYKNSASSNYTVLASAYLAAGDSMKCNIDDFHDITLQGREYEYPADKPPTIEDVEKVMAQENKSNAGFKILAAAVVGGLGGNLVGKGEAGSDSPLGTNKEKLKSSAIGALGGAALMTASTQVNDYKAGSIILSTGINAAAGAVAGNLMASGDDVLKIDKCTLYKKASDDKGTETNCIYGALEIAQSEDSKLTANEYAFFNHDTKTSYLCDAIDAENKYTGCRFIALKNIEFESADANKSCKDGITADCINTLKHISKGKYELNKEDATKIQQDDRTGVLVKITNAAKIGNTTAAMIEVSESDAKKFFGYKYSDWTKELKGKLKGKPVYDVRGKLLGVADGAPATQSAVQSIAEAGADGSIEKMGTIDLDDFHPASQSADDGTTVDFNNKARMKSTLVGTAGGAGLGALAGASGADTAIQERFVAAVREYEDSLGNISCSTGTRFLSKYNDLIIMPNMKSE